MEPGKEPRAAAGEPEPAVSFQARLWKNLQLGGKGRSGGGSGGRAATERRTADPPAPPAAGGKGDLPAAAKWSGFKRRRQVLDRVFSSSQPNLCCSAAEQLEPGGESSSALRRLREHLLPQGKGPPAGRREEAAGGDEGAKGGKEGRRPGAHLSHQKSSSLPSTACLEQLLQGSPTAGRRKEQRAEDGDGSAAHKQALLKSLRKSLAVLPSTCPAHSDRPDGNCQTMESTVMTISQNKLLKEMLES